MNSLLLSYVKKTRHHLHQFPELTWQEEQTSQFVASELRKIEGLSVSTGVGKHGVVAMLRSPQKNAPCLALRADMDALPIQEATGLPYSSSHPGVMHACGHDGHTANLLGVAFLLAGERERLPCDVRFIFQPAEEGGAGALAMIEAGVLAGVDAIFGLHGWPELPVGEIYYSEGLMMGGNCDVLIQLKGRGGHAAMPHLATDQVAIACELVIALQRHVSRRVAAGEPVVLSITQVEAAKANNVLPDVVTLGGTLRYGSKELLQLLQKEIKTLTLQMGLAYGIHCETTLTPHYPPVINHAKATAFLKETLMREIPLKPLPRPTMGAEDFSFYLEHCPGSYFFLGQSDLREGGYPSLHHPGFDFNDQSLPWGINSMASLARNFTPEVAANLK